MASLEPYTLSSGLVLPKCGLTIPKGTILAPTGITIANSLDSFFAESSIKSDLPDVNVGLWRFNRYLSEYRALPFGEHVLKHIPEGMELIAFAILGDDENPISKLINFARGNDTLTTLLFQIMTLKYLKDCKIESHLVSGHCLHGQTELDIHSTDTHKIPALISTAIFPSNSV